MSQFFGCMLTMCAIAVASVAGADVVHADTVYAVTGASNTSSSLYTVDPVTGATTLIGATGFSHVTALEFDASTGTLFGHVNRTGPFGGDENGLLIEINAATGLGTVIGETGHSIPDLTVGADGVLRGWLEFSSISGFDDLLVLNKATGAATVTLSDLVTGQTGLASLDADNIIVKTRSAYYSVNVNTGVATLLFNSVGADNVLDNWDGGLLAGDRVGRSGGTQWYRVNIGDGSFTALGLSDQRFSAVTVAVPEPATVALCLSGLLGVALHRRRRRLRRAAA